MVNHERQAVQDKNKQTLPTYGVGPTYVVSCLVLTIVGVVLARLGHLDGGRINQGKIFFQMLGALLIASGVLLWVQSVLIQKVGEAVKRGELVTDGVYAYVRNPVYTAFILAFTGILCLKANLYLLVLPIIFWTTLTILMKKTEEKWLQQKFGVTYEDYCKRVNRVIPWFKRP